MNGFEENTPAKYIRREGYSLIEKKKGDTLIVGGEPGGGVACTELSKMGKRNGLMVMNKELLS